MPNNFETIDKDFIDDLDFDNPTVDLRSRSCRYYDPMRYKYEFRQFELQIGTVSPEGVIQVFPLGGAKFSVQGLISFYISHIDQSSDSLVKFPRPPLINLAFDIGEGNAGQTLPPDPVAFGGTGAFTYNVPAWKAFGKLVTISGLAFTQVGIWGSVTPFAGDPAIPATEIRISVSMLTLPDPGSSRLTVDQGPFFVAP